MSLDRFFTSAWNFVGTLTRTAAWSVATTISSVTYTIACGVASRIKLTVANGSTVNSYLTIDDSGNISGYKQSTGSGSASLVMTGNKSEFVSVDSTGLMETTVRAQDNTAYLIATNNGVSCQFSVDETGATCTKPLVATSLAVGATLSSPHYTYAQITSNQANFSLATVSFGVRVTSDASRDIQGIAAGNSGEMHRIFNVGSFDVVLKHASGSATGKQIYCHGSADITLAPNDQAYLEYDATTQVWRAR